MPVKRERSASPSPSADIFRSESVEEQKSVFIAAFSHSIPHKALQALPEFASATHRMAAWRKRSRQRTLLKDSKILYDLGYDDDGEKWAGSRLQNVLVDLDIEGSIVVARWYGGQMIGPVRFTHIENTAKEAIRNYQAGAAAAQKEQEIKRQKKEEADARAGMEDNLRERDYSIFTLRKLLADKTAKLEDKDVEPPTPQKLTDYGSMSMETLQRVDKARDATIAYVLKQIDKVDEELKLVDALEQSTDDSWQDAPEQPDATDAPRTPV
ncbi:hypothetical protein EJ04DRAFT_213116 [Polyplosphaeria fusca]|uniref:Impact N-terminal domain-containing protein n=1 Tax=Polyplosphaeria fusca TaxID=682080 RepID=A0A9P4R789_9PLEO|nr:hypothetical protein EJ04DRAFT_213116 [Polyplosphaeria fusca]